MQRSHRIIKNFIILLIYGYSQILFAQDVPKTIDSLLSQLSAQNMYSGQVVLAEDGEIVFSGAYGHSPDPEGKKITPETPLDVASVSKTFTAAGIMLLQERGQLDLDNDIRVYFPKLRYVGVTIRHLLNHTSGLPDITGIIFKEFDHSRFFTNEDIVAALENYQPEVSFPAGAQFKYGNLGYELLGSIIEKVSASSYEQFLRDNIFKPLGMMHTFHYSEYQELQEKNKQLNIDNFHRRTVGASNIFTTAGDLLKWDRGLSNGKILNKESLVLCSQRPLLENGAPGTWGLGWNVLNPDPDSLTLQHMGEGFATTTVFTRYILENRAYIFIHTGPRTRSFEIFTMIKNIWEGKPYVAPKPRDVYEIDPALLDSYAGDYGENGYMHLTVKNGKLYMMADGAFSPVQLFPSSDTTFYFKEEPMQWEIYRSGKRILGFGPRGQKEHMMERMD